VQELDTDALVARGMRAAYDDFVAELENAAAQSAQARTRFREHLEGIGYGTTSGGEASP
jgi:hypothetical protein